MYVVKGDVKSLARLNYYAENGEQSENNEASGGEILSVYG